MESLGARLKELRKSKGVTLEEAHKKTKIHINILRAIEEDNLSNVSPIYIKGFLKIYCRFLGADPADFIANYQEPQKIIRFAKPVTEKPTSFMKGVVSVFGRVLSRIKLQQVLAVAGIILGLFLLYQAVRFVVNGAKHLFSRKAPRVEAVAPVRVSVKSGSSVVKKNTSVPVTQKPPVRKENPTVTTSVSPAIRLVIRAKEDCYVQLKTDGHSVFQNRLKKGRFETWSAKEKIELSLGNAGAVALEVNGRAISNLGRRGQSLKNIVITKEGLSVN